MPREYFIAYHDYLEPLEDLNDAEFWRLFRAALLYSAEGKTAELRGNERFLFKVLRNQIDRDNRKYAEKCERNRQNGTLGGRPKEEKDKSLKKGSSIQENRMVFSETQKSQEKEEYKDKEKDKEKDKNISLTTFEIYNTCNAKQKKISFGVFSNVRLTSDEYEKLKAEYADEADKLIDFLSEYIEMKGYKAKSHYLAIRKWVVDAFHEQKIKKMELESR